MGVVYLAERDDGEYRQEVALKVLTRGVQQQKLLRLFRNERQILAQLQHPNIVRLLDGGTDRGQVYYVMEYVEGTPITEYCVKHGLTLRQRLDLFCRVCDAVGYAHRKLIIHRDLKPGNVLVTAAGVPKLLDFGLAKALQQETGRGDTSVSVGTMLTPAYASPEQVRGEHLSVATDVYSLGVILYELLTNRNPHLDGEKSPIEACRTICEQDPCPPSQASEPRLKRQLAGDLDNIVLMALRKEPERRYGSVDELRQDIERYLGGFAVRASRASAHYLCRKYLVRHRWGVAVFTVGSIAALFAAMTIWREGHQAQARFNDVRALAHAVIFELYDSIQDLPGSTAAQKLLIDRALQYLKNLEAAGHTDDVELRLDLAAAYIKLAQVQGHPRFSNLGDSAGAEDSYARARRIARDLLDRHPSLERAEDMLAEADFGLGGIRWLRGDTQARIELGRERTGILLRKAERHPERPQALAQAHFAVAQDLLMVRDWKAALPAWKRTVVSWERVAAIEPSSARVARNLAMSHHQLGQVYAESGDLESALREQSAATQVASRGMLSNPQDAPLRESMANGIEATAELHERTGHADDALKEFRRAVQLRREIATSDEHNTGTRLALAGVLASLAPLEAKAGNPDGAIEHLAEASGAYEAALKADPKQREAQYYYRGALSQWSDLLVRRASLPGRPGPLAAMDWKRAADACNRALALISQFVPDGTLPADNDALRSENLNRLAECRRHLANVKK
jgi:tetratricopeptide (TPR) repeat protein